MAKGAAAVAAMSGPLMEMKTIAMPRRVKSPVDGLGRVIPCPSGTAWGFDTVILTFCFDGSLRA